MGGETEKTHQGVLPDEFLIAARGNAIPVTSCFLILDFLSVIRRFFYKLL